MGLRDPVGPGLRLGERHRIADRGHRLRRLRQDAEATFEYHFLNGIQGIVKDEGRRHGDRLCRRVRDHTGKIDFDLDNASPGSGALRKRCQALIESVEESLEDCSRRCHGACGMRVGLRADLVAHKEVRETYLNSAQPPICARVSPTRSFRRHHLPPLPGQFRLRRADRQGLFLSRGRRGALRNLPRS